jgi:tetratricopeptide (TPR) repeat protein
MRARAYAELGNYAAAVTDCDTALQLDPQLVPAYVTSAQANVALGRLSEAIRAADAGLARDANSIPCYANRGMARAKQAQLQEALADFDAIVERAPGDARGYWYRAAVYKLLDDTEKSRTDADRAVQLQPQLRHQQLPDFTD